MNTNTSGDIPDAQTLQTILALAADDILTPAEAATEARVSRQTIYNWIHDEAHPLTATKAGRWKIRRGDLARYIQQKHDRELGRAPEKESDQTLRAYLQQLIDVARAAVDFRYACQVLNVARDAMRLDADSFDFLERSGEAAAAKRDQLLAAAAGISDEQLTRLRFMLPSISSSLALPAPAAEGESEAGLQSQPAGQ